MNKLLKTIYTFAAIMLFNVVATAQEVAAESDVMRSNGKIYVVMAVVLTIIIGLFIYVVSLDKKISKLEKKS
jgi:CcmD family protein